MAGDGLDVTCHSAMVVAMSPFLLNLLNGSDADQVILPDFGISEICGVMNLLYTGKYVLHS